MDEYLRLNRANWDDRAPAHAASSDYALKQFVDDPDFLSGVVRFDRPRLGDITGLKGIHLQCHIGTDTISLARLGAQMTGLDLSPASLNEARNLARQTVTAIEFLESDVYAALDVAEPGAFDLVYTGIGALCWLPDVRRWAEVVSGLLRPGGRLFIREAHPMLETLARSPEGPVLEYPYFEHQQPIIFNEASTYVETDVQLEQLPVHMWNHGLGETISALLDNGLQLTGFDEHDSAPWNALGDLMVADDQGEWRLKDRPRRLAATFTLRALKR
jgi:SAM-dependent methyltransferase